MPRRIVLGTIVLACIGLVIFLFARKPTSTEPGNQQPQAEEPILSIQAFNQTTNTEATLSPAHPGDILAFILNAENSSDQILPGYVIKVNIADLAAKATLIDSGGAAYNSADQILAWTPLDIPAGQSIQQRFTARVNPIAGNLSDGVIQISFNNDLQIGITAAGANTNSANRVAGAYTAPKSGPGLDLSLLLAAIATIGWFIGKKLGITSG